MIYADNAATTRMSRKAIEAMIPYLEEYYGNPSSPYVWGQKSKYALDGARSRIASRLGCGVRDIIFTSGGSESDNHAIMGAAHLGAQCGRRHIISTQFEHHAVLKPLSRLSSEGFDVTLLDVPEDGVIRAEQISAQLRDETCLVSVMYANNEIGTIQPIAEIGAICRERGVLFHCDAVQAAGHIGVNMREMNIDMLSISAHKFHGPKGIGVLAARSEISLDSLISGGAQERGRRAGTENVAAIMGMAAALDESCDLIADMSIRLAFQRDHLLDSLLEIPGAHLNGSRTQRLPGNINIRFDGIESDMLVMMLDQDGICASAGSACASGSTLPSHVLTAIGCTEKEAKSALRLTLSEDITESEVDAIAQSVKRNIQSLR